MISPRKQTILEIIIKEHLETAAPVSSGVLVDKYCLKVSPATVRNEMMELEEAGYIYQPHTSAGRLPTEIAYEQYLEKIINEGIKVKLSDSELAQLNQVFQEDESSYRQTAKLISELSKGAVFWAFHKNDLYYTGLSNLFSQAEFSQAKMVYDASAIIDRLEEIIDEVFEDLELGTQVLIGSQNPFGNFLSTVLLKYEKNKQHGVIGILGPMRMDYDKNIALIEFLNNKFK
ncbi:MAG: hypothetical protein ACOX0C_03440 [Patescibacteria group bacterium]|jgi:heat-inducible transcriptional repressor